MFIFAYMGAAVSDGKQCRFPVGGAEVPGVLQAFLIVAVPADASDAQVLEVARLERLHRGLRPDRPEDRGLHVAVRGVQDAAARGEAALGRGRGEEREGMAGHRRGGAYARKAA